MAQVDFPYGKKRNWELDTADADIGLKSVSDSLVLAHSLRQSRDKWLNHTFRKFTSKARGAKVPDPPPPHTIMSRGRCDFIVGPHQFRQTTFYEVHYMQPTSAAPTHQLPPTPTVANSYPSCATGGTQQATATPVLSATPAATPATASGSSDDEELSQLRLALGGGLEYTISSDLVARIHHEASVNPIFATKFRLAVEPNATPEQIRNFAFALPHLPGVKVSGAPSSLTLSTEQQIHLPPVREWDLVIEYQETPNERWLIPRGTLASCSRLLSKDGSGFSEVSLTLRLPIPLASSTSEEPSPLEPSPDTNPPRPVKLTLRKAPNAVYDLILNWIGGEDKNRVNAAALAKIPKRQKIYIAHRIPQGALLAQLQAAQTIGYTMKPMKQGPSNPPRPRRKAAPKPKPASRETPIPSVTPIENGTATSVAPSVQIQKPAKLPKEPREPKRRRYQSAPKPSPIIRCIVCFKTDVPLMKGGRFCRECVNAGKADDAIPQLPQKPSLPMYNSISYSLAASGPAVGIPVATTLASSQPPVSPPPVTAMTAVATATSTVPTQSPASQSSTPSQDTPARALAGDENSVETPSAPGVT